MSTVASRIGCAPSDVPIHLPYPRLYPYLTHRPPRGNPQPYTHTQPPHKPILAYTYDIDTYTDMPTHTDKSKDNYGYYLSAIRQHISDNITEDKPELLLAMRMLSDSVTLYHLVTEQIKSQGLIQPNGRPNPLLRVRSDLFIQINKLSKELITSLPYTALKANTNKDTETTTEDFVRALMD